MFRRKKARPVSWVPKHDNTEIPGITSPVRPLSAHFTSSPANTDATPIPIPTIPSECSSSESDGHVPKIATLPRGSGRVPAPVLHSNSRNNSQPSSEMSTPQIPREHGFVDISSAVHPFLNEDTTSISSSDESTDMYSRVQFKSFKCAEDSKISSDNDQEFRPSMTRSTSKPEGLRLEDSLQSKIVPVFLHNDASPAAIPRPQGFVPVAVVSPTQSQGVKMQDLKDETQKCVPLTQDSSTDEATSSSKEERSRSTNRPPLPQRSTSLHALSFMNYTDGESITEVSSMDNDSDTDSFDSDCSSVVGANAEGAYSLDNSAPETVHEVMIDRVDDEAHCSDHEESVVLCESDIEDESIFNMVDDIDSSNTTINDHSLICESETHMENIQSSKLDTPALAIEPCQTSTPGKYGKEKKYPMQAGTEYNPLSGLEITIESKPPSKDNNTLEVEKTPIKPQLSPKPKLLPKPGTPSPQSKDISSIFANRAANPIKMNTSLQDDQSKQMDKCNSPEMKSNEVKLETLLDNKEPSGNSDLPACSSDYTATKGNGDLIKQTYSSKPKNLAKPQVPSKPSNLISKLPLNTIDNIHSCESKCDLSQKEKTDESQTIESGYNSKLLQFCLEPIKGDIKNEDTVVKSQKAESINEDKDTSKEERPTKQIAQKSLDKNLETRNETLLHFNQDNDDLSSVADSGIDTPEPLETLTLIKEESRLSSLDTGLEADSDVSSSSKMTTSSYYPLSSSIESTPCPTPPPRKNRVKKKNSASSLVKQTSTSSEYSTADDSDSVKSVVTKELDSNQHVNHRPSSSGPFVSVVSIDCRDARNDRELKVSRRFENIEESKEPDCQDTKLVIPKLNLLDAGLIDIEDTDDSGQNNNFQSPKPSNVEFDDIMQQKSPILSPLADSDCSILQERRDSYVINGEEHDLQAVEFDGILPTPRLDYQDVLPTPRLDPVEFTGVDEIPDHGEVICPAPPPAESTTEAMDVLLNSIPPPPPSTFDIDIPDAALPDHKPFSPKVSMTVANTSVPITELQNNVIHPKSNKYKCNPNPNSSSNQIQFPPSKETASKFVKALKANEEILSLEGIMVEEDYIPVTAITDSPEKEEKKMPWEMNMSAPWSSGYKGRQRMESLSSQEEDVTQENQRPVQRSNTIRTDKGTGKTHYNLAAVRETSQLEGARKQIRYNDQPQGTQNNTLSAGRLSASMESFLSEHPVQGRTRRRRHSSVSDVSAFTGLLSTTSSVKLQEVPLEKWTCEQVLQWLDAVGLEHLCDRFSAYNVEGSDLASITLQLLDDINVTSLEDRQQLLQQLQQLQHFQGNGAEEHEELEEPGTSSRGNRVNRYNSTKSHGTSNSTEQQGSIASKMEQLENLEVQMFDIEASLLKPSDTRNQPVWSCPVPTKKSYTPISSSRSPSIRPAPLPEEEYSAFTKQELLGRYLDDQRKDAEDFITGRKKGLQESLSNKRQQREEYSGSVHESQSSNSSSQTVQQLELLREIALLRESISDRDNTIESLSSKCDQLQKQSTQVLDLEHELEKTKASNNDMQRQHTDDINRLQQQISQLKNQVISMDPVQRMNMLQQELSDLQEEFAQEESRAANLQAQINQEAQHGISHQLHQLESEMKHIDSNILSLRTRIQHVDEELSNARRSSKSPQNMYELLGSGGQHPLVVCELPLVGGSYGLMLARDAQQRVFVKSSSDTSVLAEGDSLVEVNGVKIPGLNDHELGKVLKDAKLKQQNLKLVVQRDGMPMNSVVTNDEFEIFKEDLSLALVELEAAQKEKKNLAIEVDRLRQSKEELRHDNEQMKREIVDLRKKLEHVDEEWKQLREALEQQSFNQPSQRLLNMLEQMATDSSHRRPKYNQLQTDKTRKRGQKKYEGLDWLHKLVSAEDINEVLAYEDIDDRKPLWESLQGASKDEILQALKDNTLEHKQQKLYLDHLVSLVIENNPDLLERVDHRLGLEADTISLRSQTEEQC